MILRPYVMSQELHALWRVLTTRNAGLPLRVCAECEALYAPADRRASRFCSTKCRNANGVRAHRERERNRKGETDGTN